MSILEGKFESSFENAALHAGWIRDFLMKNGGFAQPNQMCLVDFAIRELFNNAVEHGNKNNRQEQVRYWLEKETEYLKISVRDEGNGFDLEEAIRKDLEAGIDSERKRGLLALRKLGWKLSARGATVTAKLEYGREQE